MKLLLASAGIKNATINDAMLELLGKPIAECSALCIPTAAYGHPFLSVRRVAVHRRALSGHPDVRHGLRGVERREYGDDPAHREGLHVLGAADRRRQGARDRRLLDLPARGSPRPFGEHDGRRREVGSRPAEPPGYAIDDDTAIRVVDGAVDLVTEGHWRLFPH
jgi:hypothetical protein